MNTRDLITRIRRIEITTRRAVEDSLGGQYHSVFKGRGMDFHDVRAYAPGDEVRAIDWNVSARTGQLHVKRFVEERELTVMVLCDLSASTARDAQSKGQSPYGCCPAGGPSRADQGRAGKSAPVAQTMG